MKVVLSKEYRHAKNESQKVSTRVRKAMERSMYGRVIQPANKSRKPSVKKAPSSVPEIGFGGGDSGKGAGSSDQP